MFYELEEAGENNSIKEKKIEKEIRSRNERTGKGMAKNLKTKKK